jgi:Protein of unknown function (DUF3500)
VSVATGVVGRMADAAQTLLDALSTDQRRRAQWEFPSDDERLRWFYTPTDHGGLTLGEMRPVQQQLTMRLLATGLSRAGYVTAATIMGLENVLDELEAWRASFGHERGRDPARYYLRIFGSPGADRWSWRFGGHHVSVHHTVVGGELCASTPCFLGADPASSPLLGSHHLRPLAASGDLAFELLWSLTEEQRNAAVLSPVPPIDLVGANRTVLGEGDGPLRLARVWRDELSGDLLERLEQFQDAEEAKVGLTAAHVDALRWTTAPKGLPASAMSAGQHALLKALLETYVRRLPDEIAAREMAKVEGPSFTALRLAWAGGLEPGRPHYYRVQGPRLLVEYDNTTRDANHVHTVWRDPVGDFGMDALGAHRRREH